MHVQLDFGRLFLLLIFIFFSFAFIALVRANSGEGFLGKVKLCRLSECQIAFLLEKLQLLLSRQPLVSWTPIKCPRIYGFAVLISPRASHAIL